MKNPLIDSILLLKIILSLIIILLSYLIYNKKPVFYFINKATYF